MRHRKIRGNLNRTSAHRRAMINNMITSLFAHERIETTVPKARAARRAAERMITYAKRNTLHARRLAHRRIRDGEVLQKLFAVLGPRYQGRPGGYTRIVRIAPRLGDGAELAIFELVDRFGASTRVTEEKPKRRRKKAATAAGKAAPEAEAEEAPVEDAEPEAEAGEDAGEATEDVGEAGGDETAETEDETPKK
jgi:large subunit ribosomal protein L17